MRRMRRQVARVAITWLLAHICLLVSIPTVFCATSQITMAAECTCDHGDGEICPMHHSRTAKKGASGEPSCSCRSTADPLTNLAASLIGPPGLAAPSVAFEVPMHAGARSILLAPTLLDAPIVPDSPPPQA